MAKYFTSLLLKGAEAFRQELADQAKQHSITVVNITAKVASVGENVLGECCSSYWVSKAAVATKNLSSELRQGKSNVTYTSLLLKVIEEKNQRCGVFPFCTDSHLWTSLEEGK